MYVCLLYNHKIPAGNPNCPPFVQRAKQVWDLNKSEKILLLLLQGSLNGLNDDQEPSTDDADENLTDNEGEAVDDKQAVQWGDGTLLVKSREGRHPVMF